MSRKNEKQKEPCLDCKGEGTILKVYKNTGGKKYPDFCHRCHGTGFIEINEPKKKQKRRKF